MTPRTSSTAPLAAIVTPVYNGQKYLAETMACVQAQTYPNLVHVVLDNASTDDSPGIISSFLDKRVPVITARNESLLSVGKNWNRAMSLAPGDAEYRRLLCADDLLAPEAMDKAIALMEKDAAVDVVASAEWLDSGVETYRWPPGEIFDGGEKTAAYFRDELAMNFSHCVFRRRAYERRAPLFYDEALNHFDVDVVLAVMSQSKVGFVRAPVAYTRKHAESLTSTQMAHDKMHYPDWLIYLHRYGAATMGAKEAAKLARRFRRYYFRRMFRWRFLAGDAALVRRHEAQLSICDSAPSMLDYADAILDGVFTRCGLRPRWTLYPY